MRVRVHRVPTEEDEQGPHARGADEQRAGEQLEDENVVLVVPVACSSRYLRDLTPARVTLTDLFRFPTIRSLARHLSSGSGPGLVDEAIERGRRRRRRARSSGRGGAGS